MPILTPPRSRTGFRRVWDTLFGAALLGSPPAFTYLASHPTFLPGWVQIGVPAALGGLVSLLVTAFRPPPQVSWDGNGLTYRWRGHVFEVPWSDYHRYDLTWDIPHRVKLLRRTGEPVTIEMFEFADAQRAELLQELAVHSAAALPN